MKKRLLTLILTLLLSASCVFSLTACGCNGPVEISFSNNFMSGYTQVPSNYREQLTYVVNYKDDSYGYNISSSIDRNSFNYGIGEYKTVLETLDKIPISELSDNDIYKSLPVTSKLLSYTTNFTMPATYVVNGEEVSVTDTITTVCYFAPYDMAFAPIYSKTTASYYLFSTTETQTKLDKVEYISSFVYSKSSYVHTFTTEDNTTVKEHDYDFKCLIDNSQLIFAIRNLTVTEDSPVAIDVVASAYSEPTTLALYFDSVNTEDTAENKTSNYPGLTINQQKVSQDVKLDKLYFKANSSKYGGKTQLVYLINNAENSQILNNRYVYKYVTPLINYGNFDVMGSLEYTLFDIVTP